MDGYTCGQYRCTATGPAGQTDIKGKEAPTDTASLSHRMQQILVYLAVAASTAALGLGVLL